jgi:hypothetical protein
MRPDFNSGTSLSAAMSQKSTILVTLEDNVEIHDPRVVAVPLSSLLLMR